MIQNLIDQEVILVKASAIEVPNIIQNPLPTHNPEGNTPPSINVMKNDKFSYDPSNVIFLSDPSSPPHNVIQASSKEVTVNTLAPSHRILQSSKLPLVSIVPS